METNKKILSMGIMVLITGIFAGLINFDPSRILQYIFVIASLAVGVVGILIGNSSKALPVRSAYYLWIGLPFIGLALALFIWATSVATLVNVLGFYLLFLALVAFVSALRILNHEISIPWKIVGLKLTLSATTAIVAASILRLAGFEVYLGLLFFGILFSIVGLTIIQVSRLAKDSHVHIS
jgi:hypothetical protein